MILRVSGSFFCNRKKANVIIFTVGQFILYLFGIVHFHIPLLNAVTESAVVFHEQVTVKRSLGSAHPQSAACEVCCRIILLLMIGGSRIIANNFDVTESTISKQKKRV